MFKNSTLFLNKGYASIIKNEDLENKENSQYFCIYKNGEFVKVEKIPKLGYFVNTVERDYLIIPLDKGTLVLKHQKKQYNKKEIKETIKTYRPPKASYFKLGDIIKKQNNNF